MPAREFAPGDVLLAWMVFSDGQMRKRRPVLVLFHFGDDDLLVAPITSHPVRVATDVVIAEWQAAGLRLASTVRTEKLATIGKSTVARSLGKLATPDRTKVNEVLKRVFSQIVAQLQAK
jgi:mRNA interferase MazF